MKVHLWHRYPAAQSHSAYLRRCGDSAKCEMCGKEEDSTHIDDKNGKCTFDQLKKDHLTDKTRINFN